VNKVSDHYDGTEDIALVMFDISHGNKIKPDAIKLELVQNLKLDKNRTRLYQKKNFQLPLNVPQSPPGYVIYGFEDDVQQHVESDSLVTVNLKGWKSSSSIYFVLMQYWRVPPYHCNAGLEVDCSDGTELFPYCFPQMLLPLFLDGLPFCELKLLHANHNNRLSTFCPLNDQQHSLSSTELQILHPHSSIHSRTMSY